MFYQIPGPAHVQVNPNRLTSAVTPIIPVQQPNLALYLIPFQPGTTTPILGPPLPQLFPIPHQDQPTYVRYPLQVPTTLPPQGAIVQSAEPIARVSQPYLTPAQPLQPGAILPVQGPPIQPTITRPQDQPLFLAPRPFQPGTFLPLLGSTIQQTNPIPRQDQPVFARFLVPAQPEVAKRTETFQPQTYIFPVSQPYFTPITQIVPAAPRLEPPPPQPWYIFPVSQPRFVQLPQIPNAYPRLETIFAPTPVVTKSPTIFQEPTTSGTISIFKPGII